MALDSQELFSGTLVDAYESLLLPLGSPPFLPSPLNHMLPSDLDPASVPQSVAGKKCLFLKSGPSSLVRYKELGGCQAEQRIYGQTKERKGGEGKVHLAGLLAVPPPSPSRGGVSVLVQCASPGPAGRW